MYDAIEEADGGHYDDNNAGAVVNCDGGDYSGGHYDAYGD
jgi:hypothetical protein